MLSTTVQPRPLSVQCPICFQPMVLRESKKFTYPDGKPRMFWGCSTFPKCNATHGAHPDGQPLGKPADELTKAERIVAHAAFDTLWKDAWKLSCYGESDFNDPDVQKTIERAARRRAYHWLREQMNLSKDECHIGNFDIEQCIKATSLCARIDAKGVRAWYKGVENDRRSQQQK